MHVSRPFLLRTALPIGVLVLTVSTLLYLAPLRQALRRGASWTMSARAAASGPPPPPPPAEGSLSEWLLNQKEAYLSDVHAGSSMSQWILTTGNEAGDLDSLASAVALSYLQSVFRANPGHHVPLVQTNRDDLRLRPENERSLRDAEIPPSSLLWLDEADVEHAFKRGAQLMLVDHNHASDRFGRAPTVRAVLDHHADEGLYPNAVPRVVEQGLGSCASLVTTHYTTFWEVSERTPLLQSIAAVLSDAIVLDTANLKDFKAKEKDYAAFSLLAPYTSSSAAAAERLVYAPDTRPPADRFDVLSDLKRGVSGLSARDLLRRDYKEFTAANGRRLGFSSVPMALSEWKTAWQPALSSWAEEQHLDVAFILTSYESAKQKRHKQVAVLVPTAGTDAELRDAVLVGFPDQGTMLGLQEIAELQGSKGDAAYRVWQQTDVGPTRKQIAPAALKAVERVSARDDPSKL